MIKIYSIKMKTPLGIQQGRLTLKINGKSLSGTIDGMGTRSEFHNGKFDGNSFEFSGQIKNLISRIQYFAKGVLNDNMLSGSVNTKYGIFSVTGKLLSQS